MVEAPFTMLEVIGTRITLLSPSVKGFILMKYPYVWSIVNLVPHL